MGKNKTIAIFTLVSHKVNANRFYGYGPYIKEMNIWVSHFNKVIIVAPLQNDNKLKAIDLAYEHTNIKLIAIPSFNIKSIVSSLALIIKLPLIIINMVKAMRQSDHLHFRSPSNVAAIAAMVQIFFPSKPKTVKYAGNWDPESKQPLGYRFQKWIFGNTLLTKNMKILVYGEWKNQSKYVVPFYTASFSDSDKSSFIKKDYTKTLKFMYLGALVAGKQPLLAIKIVEELIKKNFIIELHMYGDGDLFEELQNYIVLKRLSASIFLHGNQPFAEIKAHIKSAHFTMLPSKSEGWPKALAEGMFFGVIPIAIGVSCIPWMLDKGKRGILIPSELYTAVSVIQNELEKGGEYLNTVAKNASEWSQQFTLEYFEKGIKKILEV